MSAPRSTASDELLGPLLVGGSRTVIGAQTARARRSMALEMIRAIVAAEYFLD